MITFERINFKLTKLTFVGLISLIDPPKDKVCQAIQKCQSAGIKIIMMTGDQAATAASIAKKIGILTGKTTEDLIIDNPKLSEEEAFEKA